MPYRMNHAASCVLMHLLEAVWSPAVEPGQTRTPVIYCAVQWWETAASLACCWHGDSSRNKHMKSVTTQRSRGMVDEGIEVSVHGLAGPLLRCVLPHGSTFADLRRHIKEQLGIPKRLQSFIVGHAHVSPVGAVDAVCCRGCVDVTLVLCKPACDRCGRGDALRWCGGCRCVLYCSTVCQRGAWHTHRRVCVRPRRAMGVVRSDAPPV